MAAGVAEKVEIELAYAIGVAKPVSIAAETFGTGKVPEEVIVETIEKVFDLRPAAYGHFGRTDIELPWEKLDKVEEIKKYLL